MLGIYDTPARGTLLLDASSRVTACSFATNEHGFASLQATIQMSLHEAFTLYDRASPLFVALYDGANVVWRGRLEDTGMQSSGDGTALTITALGGWRAMSDIPYTALWSDTGVTGWRPVLSTQVSSSLKDRFVLDTNNRLFFSPKLNSIQGGGTVAGMQGYTIANGSARQIVACDFTYSTNLPANYTCRLDRFDANWVFLSSVWTLAATGATLTGSQVLTFAACDNLAFQIFYNLGAATHTGQDGDFSLSITSPRVKTTTTATVLYADEIARALVSYVAGINPTQMNTSTALIQSPVVDLVSEVYEDALPSDILSDLAARGDNQVPPRKWEVGVWEDQTVFFRPRGSAGQAWSVDVSELELERTLAVMYNSVYAVHEDLNGRALRTAAAVDAASLALAGITRRAAVGSKTTSATNAARVRDAALEDSRNPLPRAAIRFDAVYTASGASAPLYGVRSGDTITVRNLPPNLSPSIDRIRTFRISRTEYDCMDNVLSVEPEAALPTVATQIVDLAVRGSSGQPTGKQSAIDLYRGPRM